VTRDGLICPGRVCKMQLCARMWGVCVGQFTRCQERGEGEKRTLAAVARVANRASGFLRLKDLDEKMEVENAAKKHGLMS
jgi:hypothetical protein